MSVTMLTSARFYSGGWQCLEIGRDFAAAKAIGMQAILVDGQQDMHGPVLRAVHASRG
jgi:hypothetical protein